MKYLNRLSSGIISLAAIVMLASGPVSCKKEEKKDQLSGEWKLTSLNGVSVSELSTEDGRDYDVYVSFSQDGFETFQRKVGGDRYVRYYGTYQSDGTTVSGKYSDGAAWAETYSISVDGNVLTMTGQSNVCVYDKTEIPASVRSTAIDASLALKSVPHVRPL